MACHLTIAANGKVTDWRFTRALVRIDEVIAYEEAQRRIDESDAAPHLVNLWEAWRALERAGRTAIRLNSNCLSAASSSTRPAGSPRLRCASGLTPTASSRTS